MPPAIAEQIVKTALEQHLRNAASYRPFRSMSPLEIFEFFEARGYSAAFIDEAMKRIVAGRQAPPRRGRAKSLRKILEQ